MSEQKVCVITGGGSGMGLATAHRMGAKGYTVVLAGRTVKKLDNAIAELTERGYTAYACACDVADAKSVEKLAQEAARHGDVLAVIHAAGLSPHMGTPEQIMQVNALGTLHVNNAFYPLMAEGGCLIDTSSMSAYLTPGIVMPKKAYPLCRTDEQEFFRRMMKRVDLLPQKTRTGVAYGISKHFTIWCAKTDAARFGQRGVRVLSVTPGNFDTPMGQLESEEASTYLAHNAIQRFGKPDEIAALYAALVDPDLGYLTGADILCDGGCVASGASAFSR